MRFSLFITEEQTGSNVAVSMTKASLDDLSITNRPPEWNTDWTSDYILNSGFDLYAMKTHDGELVGLGAYEICADTIAVHIVYMESQAESNPLVAKTRKYRNIGRALIAFGIKLSVDAGFNGDVTLDAKTTEL